jgi:hypothetical protein
MPCSFKLVSQVLPEHYTVTLIRKEVQKEQWHSSEAKLYYSSNIVTCHLNRKRSQERYEFILHDIYHLGVGNKIFQC